MRFGFKITWIRVTWVLLICGMILSAWWFFQMQVIGARNRAIEVNVSTAKLKLFAIAQQRKDKLAEAALLSEDIIFIESLASWLKDPAPGLEDKIIRKFRITADNSRCIDILFTDPSGNIKLSLTGKRGYLGRDTLSALETARGKVKPVIADLYLDPLSGKPRFDIVAPIYRELAGLKTQIGFLVLERDPQLFLFPLIQSLPVPSRSTETLIVRRQGDNVLWLNDVRFKPDSAMKMQEPLTRTDIPAVQAVLGKEGTFRGKDYRGVEVVAYLAKVPDSDWFMISKIDTQEIFAGVSRSILIYFLIITLFLAMVIAITKILEQKAKYFYVLHEKDKTIGKHVAELENINQELEAFSYSISHDLKAPLRAITGYASILFEEYSAKLDNEAKRVINVIHENVNQMGRLIDDLLTLSHASRQAMQIVDVDMALMAQAVYEELRQSIPSDRAIEVIIGPLLPARADSRLVRQVFINLISNALKFTSTKEKAVIEVGGYNRQQENVYYVRDNGAGFDAKYVDKLFGVFVRLHTQEEFSGTGIGLAIVKNAILRMEGKVWAKGEMNQGASFYFSLPKGG